MEPQSHKQKSHKKLYVTIIICLSLALIGAVGYIIWGELSDRKQSTEEARSDKESKETTKKAHTSAPESTSDFVVTEKNDELNTYTNHKLGFAFDFPKQTRNPAGCKASTLEGTQITSYVNNYDVVSMKVLSSDNRFTIVQEQAPQFTVATHSSDSRVYNDSCKVVEVTQSLLDQHKLGGVEWRSWQVYKIDQQNDIAKHALELDWVLPGVIPESVTYQLGPMEGDRQKVEYSGERREHDAPVGGGASQTWYYPDKKLLVHIGLGQSVAFQDVIDSDKFWIDTIVDSFKLL